MALSAANYPNVSTVPSFTAKTMTDLRFALRQLAKHPGFTIVAVLTLALGTGVTTALFSIVYGVLLRPLPCPEQDRLVTINEWSEQVPGMSVSYPNFLDWRTRQQSFAAIGVSRRQSFNFNSATGTERLIGTMASYDLFSVVGMRPLCGRLFNADDDRVGAERTVMIGESLWKRRFGGNESVLEEKIQLNGDFYAVIGVLPNAVQSAIGGSDLAVPLGLWGDQFRDRANHPGLYALARLKPGVAFASATTEMRTIARQLADEYPADNAHHSIEIFRFNDRIFGSVRTPLWVLLGAAGFVLLIACANVANLQLARAYGRSREFAIRAALGAGRGRLVRQLLVESLLLGSLGCVAGVLLGGWVVDGLRATLPVGLPRFEEVGLNGWVLAFAVSSSLLTAVGAGLIPATLASRLDLRAAFSSGTGMGALGPTSSHRWRSILVAGEFALTCLLVVGASLMLRTVANLHRADLGYSVERIVSFDVELSGSAYRLSASRRALIGQALDRLAAIPAATHVAVVNPLPLRGGNQSTYYVEGTTIPAVGRSASAERAEISGDYFATLGIALVAGRTFGPQDTPSSTRVAIIDTAFVAKYFKGTNPLGKRFVYGERPPAKDSDWLEIVGVVGHIQNFGLRPFTREQTYVPFLQSTPITATFALRTDGDPATLIPTVRTLMHDMAADVAVFNFRTMDDRFASSIATERLVTILLGIFAGLALLLAAVGLYGVLSYIISQRTREIGIRMALGATSGTVVELVVKQGLRLAGWGVVVGFVTAVAVTRLLQGLLYKVSPFDPLSFVAVALVLLGVGILACWLPARHAARVNPIEALRAE